MHIKQMGELRRIENKNMNEWASKGMDTSKMALRSDHTHFHEAHPETKDSYLNWDGKTLLCPIDNKGCPIWNPGINKMWIDKGINPIDKYMELV